MFLFCYIWRDWMSAECLRYNMCYPNYDTFTCARASSIYLCATLRDVYYFSHNVFFCLMCDSSKYIICARTLLNVYEQNAFQQSIVSHKHKLSNKQWKCMIWGIVNICVVTSTICNIILWRYTVYTVYSVVIINFEQNKNLFVNERHNLILTNLANNCVQYR